MSLNLPIDFNFYSLDQGDIERMIEMWKHFYPKDEPYPINQDTIFLNKKYSKINNYELFFNIVGIVLKETAPIDSFYRRCIQVRLENPIDYLYSKFINKYKKKEEPVIIDIPEEPKKKRKKKE